jgi:acyl-CoA thioesterase-1
MKKAVVFYIVAIGLAISILILGCDNGTLETTYDATVVCFGNSLTAGYGATTPGKDDKTKSYPAYLQNKINIPVINAGKSGDTTADALKRVKTDVLSKNPKIVIIELGANDLFDKFLSQETEMNLQSIKNLINTTEENLQFIIDLLDDDVDRKIYVAKFYTEEVAKSIANNHGITNSVAQTMLISQYDDMFNSLASDNNIELIEDIWDGVWDIHMSDEVHPNAKGYEIMADNYFNAIQSYLQEHGWVNTVSN